MPKRFPATTSATPIWLRAWRDAWGAYKSPLFLGPAVLIAIVSAWRGALLSSKASDVAKVGLAVAGAGGATIVLGFVVLVVMLVLAPGRRRDAKAEEHRDEMDKRLNRIEQASSQPVIQPRITMIGFNNKVVAPPQQPEEQ